MTPQAPSWRCWRTSLAPTESSNSSKQPGAVNPALDHVARTVNLYAAAGVPLSHLKFVAVAYGAAPVSEPCGLDLPP